MSFEIVEKIFVEKEGVWKLGLCADAAPYQPVGFYADIPTVGWNEQVDGEGDDAFHSFWGPVTLRSRGEDSDRMLALLAEYYGASSPRQTSQGWLPKLFRRDDKLLAQGWTFPQTINCLAVGIESNPALIADEAVRMKLFFDDGLENGHYAEVFLEIDLPRGLGALNEKDEEYRDELIHWLSRPGNVDANPYSR
ncbi:hypothetical protein K3172_04660 [Qipengyuania sp. 6B39]|uniref:hypothetical protein n=1 Tax=Qipengyuania proteolytica TaxID=2867239 RepID=UPI001C89761B|nr:hypothetical protein [Qipengyuania proteolytica]MBX7495147.1 hypothetical protein [Qipengyuania proteolytica]